uniref:Leucine-rich repeat-containing protein 25 n=1 Tax=Anthurium amnicola TaxID=1678845 RepID=A0A1D1Y160_9ARAE
MEGAEEERTTERRQHRSRVVLRAGGSAGGLLLLGGALAATAALAVAFVVRAAAKKKKRTTKEPPQDGQQESSGKRAGSGREDRAGEGEGREGLRSLLSPLSPLPLPPSPPCHLNGEDFIGVKQRRKEEEELGHAVAVGRTNSSSKHEQRPNYHNLDAFSLPETDDFCATTNEVAIVEEPNFVQAQEKIIEESVSIEGGQGKEGNAQEKEEQDLLPVIVNKDVVVVDESKIIQVVDEALEGIASPDGSASPEEEESLVAEGSDETEGSSMESDAAEVNWSAKAIKVEFHLPSLEIHNSKVMATTTEEGFHGSGQKIGVAEAEVPAKEKGGRGLAGMVVETKETNAIKNLQVFLLFSTVILMVILAILLHRYNNKNKHLQSSPV